MCRRRYGYEHRRSEGDLDMRVDRSVDMVWCVANRRDVTHAAEEPFFLYVAFTAVHTPMHAQPQDLAPFVAIEKPKVRKLAAMTLALDRAVGHPRRSRDR